MSKHKSSKYPSKAEIILLLALLVVLAAVILLGVAVRFISPDRNVSQNNAPNTTHITEYPEYIAYTEEETTAPTQEITYVEAEAIRVSQIVQSKQSDNSFSFLAVSDMRESEENAAGNQLAGEAAALIRNAVEIDFAVLLGDSTSGTDTTTIESGIAEVETANEYLSEAYSGIPNFRAVGDHDVLAGSFAQNGDYLNNEKLYPYIGAYNSGAVNAEHTGGYCYRDFPEYKTRVITLNTSDMEDAAVTDSIDDIHMSAAQLQWFAESLDLSGKPDAREWGILILSHVPLDFEDLVDCAGKILDAYITGTSTVFTWDDKPVSYDYTEKNAPEIIANIHGHTRCFLADNMYLVTQAGAMYRSPIKRICIPNACFAESNSYGLNGTSDSNGIEFGEPETYNKKPDTAQNTSFNVVTIDRETKTIYCTNYGAGYDREIAYATGTPDKQQNPFSSETPAPSGTYTNLVPTAQVLAPNTKEILDGIGFRNFTYLSAGETLFAHNAECVVTGGIPYQVPSYGIPPTIYIWGATLDDSSHVRFFIFDRQKRNVVLYAAGEDIAKYFTIETLGDMYYKLTPIPRDDDSLLYPDTNGRAGNGFIAWSLKGTGENLVISLDEPIISE